MFDQVADATAITVLNTPAQAPKANAIGERFPGSVRRECLDHVLIFGERHLRTVLTQHVGYVNEARAHQNLGQRIPSGAQ